MSAFDRVVALWRRERVAILAAVVAVVDLAVSFGLELTPAQVGAVTAILTALGAKIARRGVWSKATVDRLTKGRGAGD